MKVVRRSSQDKHWQEVKREVAERDRGCRLCKVLSVQEFLQLKKNAGVQLRVLDPAHYKAVSHNPELCYDPNNICMLNHYSHTMLDDCRNPITGSYINIEEVNSWWIRILKGNKTQYNYLQERQIIDE